MRYSQAMRARLSPLEKLALEALVANVRDRLGARIERLELLGSRAREGAERIGHPR